MPDPRRALLFAALIIALAPAVSFASEWSWFDK
jgi:hypothetical protein